MKKIMFLLLVATLGAYAAESPIETFNESGYGTLKVRTQLLSMHRNFETVGDGYSSTLGWKIDYLSPDWNNLSFGASYIHVDLLDASGGTFGKNGEGLLSNGDVNVLNELWLKYTFEAAGLTNTFVKVGRQVLNTEVLRANEFRQKPRAFEAAILVTKDIPDTTLIIGHAERMSNVYDNGESWKYKDIEDHMGIGYSTRGVTWIEAVNTSITNLEVAAYNAYAHDIGNIAGGRVKYTLTDSTAVNGYYRHENDVGKGTAHTSDMYGASIQQKVGDVLLEPGFLSISGDTLLFSESTTGINHPLGGSMMIYANQFAGGADTYYLKATTEIKNTKLSAMYNYTTHRGGSNRYEGQELNFVVLQKINDHLSVALKLGAGYREAEEGTRDTTATDARLCVTYNF